MAAGVAALAGELGLRTPTRGAEDLERGERRALEAATAIPGCLGTEGGIRACGRDCSLAGGAAESFDLFRRGFQSACVPYSAKARR